MATLKKFFNYISNKFTSMATNIYGTSTTIDNVT